MIIEAILFAIDGTLHDSREAVYVSLEKTLALHNLPIPRREDVGPYIHHVEAFFEKFGPTLDNTQISEEYRDAYNDFVHLVTLYEHVPETLRRLRSQSLKIGAVSSSTHAHEALVQSCLRPLVDVVVGGLDTPHRKPHPEPVLKALSQLGVAPAHAVLVGDLPNDIHAGWAAGVRATIGLTHGFGTRQMLTEAGATYVIDSFSQVGPILNAIEIKE